VLSLGTPSPVVFRCASTGVYIPETPADRSRPMSASPRADSFTNAEVRKSIVYGYENILQRDKEYSTASDVI
jgi:hypothetical protein